MSVTPSKSPYLSDFLPAALVKDLRQCLRSPGYIVIVLLMLGWPWWTTFQEIVNDTLPEYASTSLFSLLVGLALALPYRAGSVVSSDTKITGGNFLMLTPLSSRRIVWAKWASTALLSLIGCLVTLPLLYLRHSHFGIALEPQLMNLGCIFVFSLLMTSFFMFTGGLPNILRILLLLALIFFGVSTIPAILFSSQMGVFETLIADIAYGIWVNVGLLLLLFLELARRHYAPPAENTSRGLRLLLIVPLGLCFAIPLLGEEYVHYAKWQYNFALVYIILGLLLDALMPVYQVSKEHMKKACWPLLPRFIQAPGFVPASLVLLLYLILTGVTYYGLDCQNPGIWKSGDTPFNMLVEYLFLMSIFYTVCFGLVFTDLFCARRSKMRLLCFAGVIFGTSIILAIILSGIDTSGVMLPIVSVSHFSDSYAAYIDNDETYRDLLFLLPGTLIFFLALLGRGCVRKG